MENITTISQNPLPKKEVGGGYECIVIQEETSKRITSLRFLLSVFVVFIHNNFTEQMLLDNNLDYVFNQSVFGKWVQIFISQGIARCAVPLFFLFAGFLQSSKNEKYSILLKKKSKSLLLPFILWNVIYLMYFGGLKLILLKIFPSIIKNPNETILTWTFSDWLHNIFGYNILKGADEIPLIVAQFWFIRDLIILIVISPILNYLVKNRSLGFLVLLIFLFLAPINTYFVRTQAIFFFVLGLYCGYYKFDLFKIVDKVKWIDILFLFCLSLFLSNYFYGETEKLNYYNYFMTLCSCVIVLKFSLVIVNSKKYYKIFEYLSQFSFWIYAIHMPVLLYFLQKIWIKFLPMKNTALCLAEYFGVNILNITISLTLGILLKKICPKLFKLLCGGR